MCAFFLFRSNTAQARRLQGNVHPSYHFQPRDSPILYSLLSSPTGEKFTKVFIDEFHDVVNGHPDRFERWKTLGQQFVRLNTMFVLMSATAPPHLLDDYIKPLGLNAHEITESRSPTNRPEIGMHTIRVSPIKAPQALHSLVLALQSRLVAQDRMLVFFSSIATAASFAKKAKCALYHSELSEDGNTKADNLQSWDSRQSSVMACTTAFAQGVDRSNVRYVIIYKPSYGLVTNNQMLGRAGRDGNEAHVFFLTDQPALQTLCSDIQPTNRCVMELNNVVNGPHCRRHTNMVCMDGYWDATTCLERPYGVPCDVCDPESEMQLLATEAVKADVPQPTLPRFVSASKSLVKTPPSVPVLVSLLIFNSFVHLLHIQRRNLTMVTMAVAMGPSRIYPRPKLKCWMLLKLSISSYQRE